MKKKKIHLKRYLSIFLTFVLTLGLLWTGNIAEAATTTTLEFIDGGYNNDRQIYVVNVKSPDDTTLDTINTIAGTVLVNGVETAVKWEGYNSPNYYQLLIPYSAIYFSTNTSHAEKQGSSYITVPAGTTIGNITVSQDFHVKIYGGTTTSNDSLIEPVSEVPEYYYASWNYNKDNLYIQFRNTIGTTANGWVASTQNVYVDGTAVSVRWEGDGSYYYFPLAYSQLGATSLSDMSTHIIRIPKDTVVGEMTLSEDVYIKVNSSVREELVPASISLGTASGYHDGNGQYVIRLVPEDGRTIITPGASSTKVLIDGVEVENAISSWDQGSDNYGACIKYSVIESDATSAADIGVHTITFPAGTYFGNRILTEDFSVCINGESQISTSSPFSLTTGGYQDGQPNNNYRYIFWLKPTDGRDIVSLGSTSATILVDGKKVSSGVSWVDTSATGGYALAVNYSAIESDAAVSTDVGEHIITIPAGTVVGDVAFAEDFMIKVNGRDISVYKPPVTVSLADYSSYQNSPNYRYIFYLIPDDGREIVGIGSPSTTILVDGQEVSSGISWFAGSESYALCVKYSAIVSDATSYDQIGEHVLTVPAGTKVGDVELAEDFHIKINNGTLSELTPVTLQHTETVCGLDGYQMQFTVEGATSTITKILNAEVSVDGKVTDEATYNFGGTAEDGYYIQLSLPYDAVQSGATSAAEVTETHTIQIGKGALLSDMVLKESVDVLVTGETVTQIRKPDVTVAISGHDDNATSGTSGFYFTVAPEDALAYNSDGTVKYIFVKDGISVDGTLKNNVAVTKLDSGLYYVDLSSYTVQRDTIVGIGGIIQTDDYTVEYTETYFQYKTTTGWSIYIPPTSTEVTLSNDTINGGENMSGIYMNASSDSLSNGVYASDAFSWDSMGDDDDTLEQHGGVYLNGNICSTATLQKKWDGYYYIDLSNVTELKAGDIITLDGTLFVDNHYVTYNPISYIRNKDGSFSQYDANAEAVPAETVKLNALYVNLDKQTTYTIPSTPLVTGNKVTIMVNGNEVTDYTLTKAGTYIVKRIMENTILADVVSTVGDITYEQNVYMFRTGDVNLDASVSVKDIVRMKKNMGKTENLVGGASDLNYDDKLSEADYELLVDLILGKTTAEEIISADQSVVIGAISDTHYLANGRDGQNRINTRKALNYYKSQNVDVLILNGDITDLGEVGAYEELVADIKAVYPDEATRPKVIFTGDNHEWYDAWDGINGHIKQFEFEDVQKRFCDELSELRENSTDTNTHYKVNGYHFIGVSSDNMNGGYSLYDDETVNWVESTLAAAAADDATGKKPIFLSIHQAPKNTVYGSDGADHFDDSETKLTEILAKYPQLVIITSHTHATLQDERSIHQGNYTTLNTASTYYVGGAGGTNVSGGLMSEKYQFAQGLLIKTNGNIVDVERCDFYNDEKIKDNWTFETSDSTDDYTKYTDARANDRVAPTFASGASISATWTNDNTATLTFDAATHDDFVHHYIVKVYKDGSTTPSTYTYSSLFYLGLNNMDKTVEFTVSNLDATKDYRFEIQAVESWGNTSIAISGSLSAK